MDLSRRNQVKADRNSFPKFSMGWSMGKRGVSIFNAWKYPFYWQSNCFQFDIWIIYALDIRHHHLQWSQGNQNGIIMSHHQCGIRRKMRQYVLKQYKRSPPSCNPTTASND